MKVYSPTLVEKIFWIRFEHWGILVITIFLLVATTFYTIMLSDAAPTFRKQAAVCWIAPVIP